MTLQRFTLPDQSWEAESDPATPVYLAGPHMYQICSIGGRIRPYGDEHLVGMMGGAWAHPVRVLHGWCPALQVGGEVWPLDAAERCDLSGVDIVRHYRAGPAAVTWAECIAEGAPALISLLRVENTGAEPLAGALLMRAELDMRGCWFGGWGAAAPQAAPFGALLAVTGDAPPFAGRAAALLGEPDARWAIDGAAATLRAELLLAPGEARELALVLAVAHSGGGPAASALAHATHARARALIEERRQGARELLAAQALRTPDPQLDRAWQLARLNLAALRADYPDLPPYLLAGLPEYPQLFGCDTEYSAAGATIAGFGAELRSTLAALAGYAQRACARVPHEVTTNGRVFNPGNTQETPQFAVACWDYLRWSGDLALIRELYPLCVEGLEHFAGAIEHGGYPHGDGVVERLGMGACKLDSVCYLHQALAALAELAAALGRPGEAARFAQQAAALAARFERDWWIEAEGLYADSLHLDGRAQLDGHWTVVLPAQTGIAARDRAERTMRRIEREWLNEWGMVHTRNVEPRVWTLPTGLLALAACEHGRPTLALRLLRGIATTAEHGALGTLKELIPQGICFIQLWSSAMLAQGVVEGLLGVRPRAHERSVEIRPHLPEGWPEASLRGLSVAGQTLDLQIRPGEVSVAHRAGGEPLTIIVPGARGAGLATLAPGGSVHMLLGAG